MTGTSTRPSYRGFQVEVADVVDISPSFRRLTLTGPDLHDFGDALLDQRIKLILATPTQIVSWPLADTYAHWRALPDTERPAIRTYTVAGLDSRRRLLMVDVACRPVHGPASHFAASARIGDPLLVLGPDRLSPDSGEDGIAWRPGASEQFLIVGDETALPAIRNILICLPHSARGQVVLELPTRHDAVDLHVPPGLDLHVVVRSGPPGRASIGAVRDRMGIQSTPWVAMTPGRDDLIWDEIERPRDRRYGWLAGEAGGVMAMRRDLLTGNALARSSASFMGYWKQGRSEG